MGNDGECAALVENVSRVCQKFVPAESVDGEPHYLKLIEENSETQNNNLNVNGFHLFSHNPNLYEEMIRYPREMLPIFDMAVQMLINEDFSTMVGDQIHPMQVGHGLVLDLENTCQLTP